MLKTGKRSASDRRPPITGAAFAGFQHLLAMFGGILAAPLLVAVGMGLDASDTTYLISAAIVVSGFATLVQINRLGMLGTGQCPAFPSG